MKFLLSFLLLCLSITSSAQTLRLAVYQYAENQRIKNLEPLARHLEKTLQIDCSVKSYPTVHAFIDAIRRGEVDIAFINTFGYLLLETGKHYSMYPAVALTVPVPEDNYKTAFIVRKEIELNAISELPQHSHKLKLALVAKGSTSGNLVPRLALAKTGLYNPEKDFRSLTYAGTHANAIQQLLGGTADIAAMGSSEFTKLSDSVRQKLRQIWLSTEIPLGPVLFHKRIGKTLSEKIRIELLNIHHTAPETLESLKDAWSEAKQATHFINIQKNHYEPFLLQFGTLKQISPILKQFVY